MSTFLSRQMNSEMETVTRVGHEYLLITMFGLGCLDFLARLDGTLFYAMFWSLGDSGVCVGTWGSVYLEKGMLTLHYPLPNIV